MAHVTADRVRDTSTTTGTGAFTVSGSAPTGYRTFSAVCSTSDTFWYAIAHQSAAEWEVGLGTYSSSNTVTRTTVLKSSNSNSAVSFSAGTKDVFITLAADKTVQQDNSGNASVSGILSDVAGNLRDVPQNAQTSAYTLVIGDNGKHVSITTGGVTVPASVFAVGDTVTIYNNSASSQTITQGSSATLRQAGTANTGNRTLAQRGLATILCVASNEFVITGSGVT
jgi:hypothetical protein